jgi:transcriptional regulator with XRE-family HTH domain
MIDFNIIGERIKKQRNSEGISQKRFAQLLDEENISMSRETISKIENGTRAVNAIEIDTICRVLNVSLDEIFEDEETDLVSLFRTYEKNISDEMIEEIEFVQDFIDDLIMQKKIFNDEMKLKKYDRSW